MTKIIANRVEALCSTTLWRYERHFDTVGYLVIRDGHQKPVQTGHAYTGITSKCYRRIGTARSVAKGIKDARIYEGRMSGLTEQPLNKGE
jgi:hypothetical protein